MPNQSRARDDLIVLAILCLFSYFLAIKMDLFEKIATWAARHEAWEADELLTLAMTLTAAFALYSVRRWREYRSLLASQSHTLQALIESEERYRQLTENSLTGMFIHQDGVDVYANQRLADMLGYTKEEMIGGRFLHSAPSQDLEIVWERARAHINDQPAPASFELRILRKTGEPIWCEVMATAIDYGGRPAFIGNMMDITPLKEAEKALRESEVKYREFFSTSRDCVFITSPDGSWLDFNESAMELFGYDSRKALSNVPIVELYADAEDRLAFLALIQRQGFVKEHPVKLKRKSGEVFDSLITASCLRHADGSASGFSGTIRDVTDRRKAEEALRKSEEKLKSIFSAAPVGIGVVENRVIKEANDHLCQMTGYGRSELLNVNVRFLYATEEEFEFVEREKYKQVAEKGKGTVETFWRRKDGEVINVLLSSSPINPSNMSLGVTFTALDITERKRAEGRLAESEERFRLAFENANIGVCLVDTEGRFLRVNDRLCEIWGYSKSELETMSVNDVTHPEDLDISQDFIEAACLGEVERDVFEKRYLHKLGHVVWGQVSSSLVRDRQGNPLYYIAHVQNFTDRKRAEEELRATEQRYRSLVEESFDGIFLHKGTKVVFANSRLCEMLGYERSEVEGLDFWRLYHPDYHDITRYRAQARMRGEAVPSQYEVMLQRKDGSSFYGEILAKVLEVAGGPGVQVWVRDITARREAEQELRRSEERYRTLFEESKDGVFLTADDGRVVDVNQSLLDMLGYTREELLGLNIAQVYADPSDRDKYRRAIKEAGSVKDYPITFKRKDGKEIHCLETASCRLAFDGAIIGCQGITRDVSEQEHLQEQLIQAQKMEAVGTLAGGVAHDFNNILQVALGYSELILGDEGLPQRYKPDLQKINESARRGADLVQRLLTFSRKTQSNPQPLSVNRRINEIGKMLERTIPKMIDIRLMLDEDLAAINADPTQLDQVLMNLAVNARDAMPDGGKLIIETANILLDEEYARTHLDVRPGHYVLLMVTDTGSGMDKDTLEHIFEPFYTTKGAGEGTGLGLAVVHGIVQQHGGFIRCYSEPGAGTTFNIYFPALVSDEAPEERVSGLRPRGGSETILVADDDEMVRDLCSRILVKAGYTVIAASSGKEALERYKTQGEGISLVILDLIMPEMSGKQCLEGLLSLDPSIKVVIASGYSANGPTKDALSAGAKGFVNKPYDIRQVLAVVREILDAE